MRQIASALVCLLLTVPGAVLAATPPEVERPAPEAVYRNLVTLPMPDRKAAFRALTPAMKAEVWRVQFREFAAENVVSPAQAAIIEAADNLFSEGLFSTSKSDPDWEGQVHVPLQRLEQSARNVFPPDMLLAAFGQLGPGEVEGTAAAVSMSDSHAARSRLIPAPLLVSECTCSVASDWCFFGTCGGAICWKADSDTGCGFGWRYECDSQCNRN
jgi:hypothetical protein